MANDYLKKHKSKEDACKAMLRNQIVKCTTSGVVTGFGGFITMPVALPANVGSVIYVQMRMIACDPTFWFILVSTLPGIFFIRPLANLTPSFIPDCFKRPLTATPARHA